MNEHKEHKNVELDIVSEIYKYISFWPWLLISLFICLFLSHLYLRYTPNQYETTAKVLVLDKRQGLELPSAKTLFSSSINLENEIEALKSYPILEETAKIVGLTESIYAVGRIKNEKLCKPPFNFKRLASERDLDQSLFYEVSIEKSGLKIFHEDSTYYFKNFNTYLKNHDLPFEITINPDSLNFKEDLLYTLILKPMKNVVNELKNTITFTNIGARSEIISMTMVSENTDLAEKTLNTLIDVYNNDGINDRRLVHKRTIDFINDRFITLGNKLDSIELYKQFFKLNNNLIDISTDVNINLELRSESEKELFSLETQLALAKLLSENLNNPGYRLFPTNIGIENNSINKLISDFNEKILARDNLIISGGENNPNVKKLNSLIKSSKENISSSIHNYTSQLKKKKQQFKIQNNKYNQAVSSLPEKEKVLRSIERSQEIEESLYLFLLQKREESEVSYAVTEPGLKVVEYAISNNNPVSPKRTNLFISSFIFGLILPLSIIFIYLSLDSKIHSKLDLELIFPNNSMLGEIPNISDTNLLFSSPNQRSVLAESSRILASNTQFLLGKTTPEDGKVIITTSTVKGEGKTFVALNLSLALASLNKKVLLIGSDLRNPQVHNYINCSKSDSGLINYLIDNKFKWKGALKKAFTSHPSHDILIAGKLTPNPVQLLSNGNINLLINDAKTSYDYIVMDCAPTILVTDTLLISNLADATVYLTRAHFTEKRTLSFIESLINEKKLKNVGFVVNGLDSNGRYGYRYSYGYKYGYNYGYGYGYGAKENKKT